MRLPTIAAALLKRTQEALARTTPPVTGLPPIEEPAPVGIDPRFITYLHGKAFVRYAGLLAKAHEAGLVKLEARIEFHSDTLVLASATATFSDGRVFTEWADATPENVAPGASALDPDGTDQSESARVARWAQHWCVRRRRSE